MLLKNKGGITIETYDKRMIEKLMKRGFSDIYDDAAPIRRKKKSGSTGSTKESRSS